MAAPAQSSANAFDYMAVRNVIARYCIALDTKDFELLKGVFTEDVETSYPFKSSIIGVQNVADAIKKR